MQTVKKASPISKPVQQAVSFSPYFEYIRAYCYLHTEEFIKIREIPPATIYNLEIVRWFLDWAIEICFISISKLHKVSLIFQVSCLQVKSEIWRLILINWSSIKRRITFYWFLSKFICYQDFLVKILNYVKWTKILLLSLKIWYAFIVYCIFSITQIIVNIITWHIKKF